MIELQIVYSRLVAVARELSETVGRTARSRGLAEARRFSAALLTGEPKLAVQFQQDPAHSYLSRSSAAALLEYFAFDVADGDVIVVGDPFSGGSTPQFLTFAAPVFTDGELVAFPLVRAELADLGGELPGNLHPRATEIWQESIRVTPVKLYRHGVLQRDILRFLLRNGRAESLVRSDIEAIVAALRTASASIAELVKDRGRLLVTAAIDEAIERGHRLSLSHLARWRGLDQADRLDMPRIDGRTSIIALRLRVNDNGLDADFSGTGPQTEDSYNITLQHARGCVLAAAFADILDEIVLNDGVLESVAAGAPPATLVNPTLPAATGLADLVTAHVVAGRVRRTLFGDAAEDRLDGPAPALVVFAPIGSTENNTPFALDPGFTTSAQGWGAPILAGRRLLPSAEILEARDGFELLAREKTADGMIASLRNRRGVLEVAALVPRDQRGALGSVVVEIDGQTIDLAGATATAVPDRAVLHIHYPSYRERGYGEA
jgi:N-methylhydantoinase B